MIRDCPTLRAKVAEKKSRDSGNTILQKSYPGGILTMCGSTEAHALASKPIRYVLGDERDRWAVSAGTEGDPWELAMARQTTFYNAKAVEVSTPTIKGHSAIAKSYVKGTMERWVSQCRTARDSMNCVGKIFGTSMTPSKPTERKPTRSRTCGISARSAPAFRTK